MKFGSKVHSTTATQIKHTKENQIRTNLEWFVCTLGIQKCKDGKGRECQKAKGSLLLTYEAQSRPPCQT